MSKAYEYIKDIRIRTKERLVKYFGGKCQSCGYDRCINSFDFHHVDPYKKEFNIGSMKIVKWSRVLKEAKKCVLLCSNCHREIHAGARECPDICEPVEDDYDPNDNKRFYKWNWDNINLLEEIQNKSFNGLCEKYNVSESCLRKHLIKQGHVFESKIKFDITKDELFHFVWIEKVPFVTIGKMFGVSDNAIRKRCKKLGIEVRKIKTK